LRIRQALPARQDAVFFWHLWSDPRVMKWVGFPEGLGMTRVEVRRQLTRRNNSPFENHLIAEIRANGTPIGECFMGLPDGEGIAETDLKLLPEFWQQGYGSEIKRGLLDYLFTYTDCCAVRATPNVENQASIRMQESVGGIRVGETRFESPQSSRCTTKPVQVYIYLVTRTTWLERRIAAETRNIQQV
jgi:RimJ/RimL family protein N-acetyltransferase